MSRGYLTLKSQCDPSTANQTLAVTNSSIIHNGGLIQSVKKSIHITLVEGFYLFLRKLFGALRHMHYLNIAAVCFIHRKLTLIWYFFHSQVNFYIVK